MCWGTLGHPVGFLFRNETKRNETHLRGGRLEPEQLRQVVSVDLLEGVLENLHLLHQRQLVIAGVHLRKRKVEFWFLTVPLKLLSVVMMIIPFNISE